MLIINPGTAPIDNSSLEEAIKSAKEFARCLDLPNLKLIRNAKKDDDGFFGFKFKLGNKEVEVEIPGEKSEIFLKSKPFVSIVSGAILFPFTQTLKKSNFLLLELKETRLILQNLLN